MHDSGTAFQEEPTTRIFVRRVFASMLPSAIDSDLVDVDFGFWMKLEFGHSRWCIIEGLARLRVFLDQTDHLSDRELYTQLLRELLPEAMPALEVDENSAWHIDVLGYDKPELYLK